MNGQPDQWLLHAMGDSAKTVGAVTQRSRHNGWWHENLPREAVISKMHTLGKATRSVSKEFKQEHTHVMDWKALNEICERTEWPAGLRDLEWLWNTADTMPTIARAIREMLPLEPKTGPVTDGPESETLLTARYNLWWPHEKVPDVCHTCGIERLWLRGAVLETWYCDLDDVEVVYEKPGTHRGSTEEILAGLKNVFGPLAECGHSRRQQKSRRYGNRNRPRREARESMNRRAERAGALGPMERVPRGRPQPR